MRGRGSCMIAAPRTKRCGPWRQAGDRISSMSDQEPSSPLCSRGRKRKTERRKTLRFPKTRLDPNQVQTIAPLELSQTLADCECDAVAVQVGGVVAAAVAATVTFCDGVKPCADPLPEKYPPLLSAAYCSSYVARLRRSDFIAATYALSFVFANFGIAIAARMPIMTTTIRSSISVKPFLRLDICWATSGGMGRAAGHSLESRRSLSDTLSRRLRVNTDRLPQVLS